MQLSEFEEAYDDMEMVRGAVLETAVKELMAWEPVVVESGASVRDAVQAMNDKHIGCVLVGKAGKLVGIFTERDVLRKVVFQESASARTVDDVMTPNPETLPPDATVAYALNKMSVDGYRHIPIMNRDGQAIGVLSIKDIVNFVAEFFPGNVLNLPSDPRFAYARDADGG